MVSYSQYRYSRYNKQCLTFFWFCSLDYQIYQRQVSELIRRTTCVVHCFLIICVAPSICVPQGSPCISIGPSSSTQCCQTLKCVQNTFFIGTCASVSTTSTTTTKTTTTPTTTKSSTSTTTRSASRREILIHNNMMVVVSIFK